MKTSTEELERRLDAMDIRMQHLQEQIEGLEDTEKRRTLPKVRYWHHGVRSSGGEIVNEPMSEGEYQEAYSDPEPEYVPHAVREAIYAETQAGDFWPSLSCDCGFAATAKTWEEAGALYDKHLEGKL